MTTFDRRPLDGAEENSSVCQAVILSGIFNKTEPETVAALSAQLTPVRFSPGQSIADDGNIDGCLYVVISGKVKVFLRRSNECEIVLNILGPADIFGAVALFGCTSRDLCITALTEVLAVPIARDRFRAWMNQQPEIGGQMLRLLARWTKTMTDCLVEFVSADAQARLASRLLSLRKRFGWQDGDAVRVVHDMTLEDFSLLVGVGPDEISAALSDFANRGWIRLDDDSVVIVDAEALRVRAMRSLSFSGVSCD
jgi:CRP/FNR family transcriptional regulator